MSRADWYSFHVDITPIDTEEGLAAALADPDQAWYARRRLAALAASGALVATTWQEHLHPRGRDGKFIEKFGWVRWFDDDLKWKRGQVRDIKPNGLITVRESNGTTRDFQGAGKLYAQPKPKAKLSLPNLLTGKIPEKWKKIGGQGGSNPGGVFQMEGSFGGSSPELGKRNQIIETARQVQQVGAKPTWLSSAPVEGPPEQVAPTGHNVAIVPRLDGTPGRYDVLQQIGGKWYRTPESGGMIEDDLAKPELAVTAEEAFGAPHSPRRYAVIQDLGSMSLVRSSEHDVDDVAQMFQKAASPLPQVGDQYYVKTMNIPERARNEALANELYEMLGVPVPDVAVGEDGVTISSKIVADTVPFDPNDPKHIGAAQEGFVADAFLSNWDVVGLSFDNIRIDPEGRAWRIDAGGALAYRAMGKPKGPMFGDEVGELSSLRNASLNAKSAKVFASIPNYELTEQAKKLQGITPAELQAVAEAHDMPWMGATLVARRKSVLDQLGIPDPPPQDITPTPPPPSPKPVYNPVDAVKQMGSPPAEAVHNYKVAYNALKTATLDADDWQNPDFITNAIFKADQLGGLWVFDSGNEVGFEGKHRFMARNLLTGDKQRLVVTDGQTEYLWHYSMDAPDEVEAMVDDLAATRDMAVAEFVARADGMAVTDISNEKIRENGDPLDFNYFWRGVPNWTTLSALAEAGKFGANNERPLYDSNGDLWEVMSLPTPGDEMMVLQRRTGPGAGTETMTLDPESYVTTPGAPFFIAGNDVTAAVAQSKYVDLEPDSVFDPDAAATNKALADALDPVTFDDEKPTLTDEGEQTVFDPANPDTWHVASDDEFNKAFGGDDNEAPTGTVDDELEALIAKEEAIAQALASNDDDTAKQIQHQVDVTAQAMADAQPTGPGSSKKVTNDVVDGLGAGEPALTTEWALSDLDDLANQWVGKNVVVLPIDAHDNPDWVGENLGASNGLGTIISAEKKNVKFGTSYAPVYEDVVQMTVQWPNGSLTYLRGGDKTKFPKVVIPVESAPAVHTVVFKGNGDITANGEVVGKVQKFYGGYSAVIDGKHTLTGKPMEVSGKNNAMAKSAVNKALFPIPPKVTKPKSSKVTATEDEIKALNLQLAEIEANIAATEQSLADLANIVQPADGTTELPDGSFVGKGDWVFSTKDGVFAQIKQIDPKLGPKHTGLVNNYVKVAIPQVQPDGSTKWKWTNRPKENLVAAAAPGETPVVMQTKALKDMSGDYWIGPGVQVALKEGVSGQKALVVDTTVDGKVKYQWSDGTQHWTTADKVFVHAKADAPTVKTPAGADAPNPDELNAQLAALNDEKVKLADTIANTAIAKPKAKKPVGTPYPGPNGKTVVQPKWVAEQREAKGLKNLKDGYVPTVGMILRHNDGTQYVVIEMGTEWSSHKNSVRVMPVGGTTWDAKWRALTTLTVDHHAMLTDADGKALPIVTEFEGMDWAPDAGLIYQKTTEKSYLAKNADGTIQKDPITGYSVYRKVEKHEYFVVGYAGGIFHADGSHASSHNLWPPDSLTKVGYIDKSHPSGGKKLTVSIQEHHNAQVGKLQYAVIHEPDEEAAIPLAKKAAAPTTSEWGGKLTSPGGVPGAHAPGSKVTLKGGNADVKFEVLSGPDAQGQYSIKGIGVGSTYNGMPGDLLVAADDTPTPPPSPEQPAVIPEIDESPDLFPDAADVQATPTAEELPIFGGKDPAGSELPHPAVQASTTAVQLPAVQGGTPTLDKVGLPGAHSVTASIQQTLDIAKSNKQTGEKKWVTTYGLADGDHIEDMVVQSQTVRDAKGEEFVEVRFRLAHGYRNEVNQKFITSSTNQTGDWSHSGRNAKNLALGDKLAVRIASGGGVTVKGALRPDGGLKEGPKTPNAVVVAAPVLIGKNKAGTFDVYRTQVMTANGDFGFIDVEDRGAGESESLYVSVWDPTKPRVTTAGKDLNPNAKAEGWSIKHSGLAWDRAGSNHNVVEHHGDGVKKLGGNSSVNTGSGWTLQRDYEGAHLELRTAVQTGEFANSLDGFVTIRVPADDPEAHRKISEAMEMVGVDKEAQKPPDREALQAMAVSKVYTQFAAKYTPGMKAKSPQDALDAIDAAVGKELGRKATLDDITMRMADDGRVQVLVSEDISRAIVKRNGIKAYQHGFSGGGFTGAVVDALKGENPGALSTVERWQSGLFFYGMSSVADHANDAAGHMFLRMTNSTSISSNHLVMDAVMLHRQLDYYWRPGDTYGKRQSDNLGWLHSAKSGGGNEMMLQRRIEPKMMSHVVVGSAAEKAKIIADLKAAGITEAPNGRPLDDFFVLQGGTQHLTKTLPSLGDEVAITALPEVVI
jgi:hypothetical protein